MLSLLNKPSQNTTRKCLGLCYNVFIYIFNSLRTMILASIQNMQRTGMNWTFYTEICQLQMLLQYMSQKMLT